MQPSDASFPGRVPPTYYTNLTIVLSSCRSQLALQGSRSAASQCRTSPKRPCAHLRVGTFAFQGFSVAFHHLGGLTDDFVLHELIVHQTRVNDKSDIDGLTRVGSSSLLRVFARHNFLSFVLPSFPTRSS